MRAAVSAAGYPVLTELPTSGERFGDGSRYRIEIPSCEGPAVMAEVVQAAAELAAPGASGAQGSGLMMFTDSEIWGTVSLGAEHAIEVNLFIGPRGSWDIGGQAKVTAFVRRDGAWHRDGRRVAGRGAPRRGLRRAQHAGRGPRRPAPLLCAEKSTWNLPADLVLKTSVLMPLTNAATARVYDDLGATRPNTSTDLAEIRAVTECTSTSTSRCPMTRAAPSASTTGPSWSGSPPPSTSSSGCAPHLISN